MCAQSTELEEQLTGRRSGSSAPGRQRQLTGELEDTAELPQAARSRHPYPRHIVGIDREKGEARSHAPFTSQPGTRALIAFARAEYSIVPSGEIGNPSRTFSISLLRSVSGIAVIIFVVGT